jgi:Xaa-Pro aminopeptidase
MSLQDPGAVERRLDALKASIKAAGLTGFLITCPENRRYYSGFTPVDPMLTESSGSLYVTARRQALLTDSRYIEAAREEAPLYEIVDSSLGLAAALGPLVKKGDSVGFESGHLTVAAWTALAKKLPDVVLAPLPFDPSAPREVKSPAEVKLIAKALSITEAAVGRLWERVEPGWTEEQAAYFLDFSFKELGAEGPAFETIVASGPRAALPHAVPGPRKIRQGEMVVVDCGARWRGYASDITRTFCCGEPKPWQRRIYSVVREAQQLALAALGPGRTGAEIDAVARAHIEKAGFGRHFGHGLGHGVGLAVHEAPRLGRSGLTPLKPGAVVTVEPGIYLPGRGGVRLEQLALITESGAKVLNRDHHFFDFGPSGF